MNSKFSAIVNPKLLPALKEQSITLEDLRFIYFGDKPASNETRMNYANLINDLYFVHSAYEAADIQMRMGHRSTYMYKFSYDSGNSFIKIATNIDLPGTLIISSRIKISLISRGTWYNVHTISVKCFFSFVFRYVFAREQLLENILLKCVISRYLEINRNK